MAASSAQPPFTSIKVRSLPTSEPITFVAERVECSICSVARNKTQRHTSRMTLNERIAANLKLFRTAKNLTQDQLALRSGLSRGYLGQIERGQVNITIDTVGMLADGLGVDAYQLAVEPPS